MKPLSLQWRVAQFLERRWWQRYLHKRDKTQYLAWKTNYWRDFLKKTGLSLPYPARILDAGCGPAGIFTILNEHQVDALDPLITAYEQDLPHFRPADYPWVRFVTCPLEQFEATAVYDAVFCLNAINHVSDLPLCLARLADCCAPQGALVLSVDVHRHPWLKPLFRAIPGDALHPQQHSLQEYEEMLKNLHLRPLKKVCLKQEAIFEYWLLVFQKDKA